MIRKSRVPTRCNSGSSSLKIQKRYNSVEHQQWTPPHSWKGIFPFSINLGVRGYEIDSFGHVNNAVYLNWLEHARWEMVSKSLKETHEKPMMQLFGEVRPVIRRVELDYVNEVKLGDEITYWPRSLSTTSFTFGARIKIISSKGDQRRVGKPALFATILQTCVKPGAGKVEGLKKLYFSHSQVPEGWKPFFAELKSDPGHNPHFLD